MTRDFSFLLFHRASQVHQNLPWHELSCPKFSPPLDILGGAHKASTRIIRASSKTRGRVERMLQE